MSRLNVSSHLEVSGAGKPIVLFPVGFVSQLGTIKECILVAYPACPKLDELVETVEDHIEHTAEVRELMRERGLVPLEAQAICIWTADLRSLGCRGEESVYVVYGTAVRTRNMHDIGLWKDYSFWLIGGLEKLQSVSCECFRGEGKRVLELSRQYAEGNQVCWVSFASTTTELGVALKQFGKHGTIFKLIVRNGRDIRVLSLFRNENELLLPPNSTFVVELALACEKARLMGGLATLPEDVDMIVLREVPTKALYAVLKPSATPAAVADAGASLAALSVASPTSPSPVEEWIEGNMGEVVDAASRRLLVELMAANCVTSLSLMAELSGDDLKGMGVPLGLQKALGIAVKAFQAAAEIERLCAAADRAGAAAQNDLGYKFQHGKGVAQDYGKAVEMYRKAADQGYADGQCNLGYMYHFGLGVAVDYGKAVELYRLTADQGNAFGQNNLGNMYRDGRGVAVDNGKALELFRKVADQGNSAGQDNLGWMYEHGLGVSRDLGEARRLYGLSAAQGNEHAKKRLEALK